MIEERVPLTDEEAPQWNKQLRGKRRGMLLVLLLLPIATGGVLYLLQQQEQITDPVLYGLVGGATVLCLLGVLLFLRFSKKLEMDIASQEKIVTIGILVRFMEDPKTRQQSITLDYDGGWITLSIQQLRRLVPNVIQTQRLMMHDRFLLEFTPYGNHLMRATRL